MYKYFFSTVLLFVSITFFTQQSNWSTFIDSVSTLSSPRAVDLNLDGIKDIVVGAGTDSTFSNYGVIAFDGFDGNVLWSLASPDEIFTSAIFNDINNDSIPDVFIGGRNAQFYAIDGSDGSIIWEAFPQNSGLNPSDSGWYNFYSGQFINDQNGDNIKDVLVANGGDHTAAPWDPRPTGHLMILDGLNGSVLAKAACADSGETYCSPVVIDQGINNSPLVVYGTGGEHSGGNMFVTTLTDLMNNDISMSVSIASDTSTGFIAPPSIADLNLDNYKDIVVQSFGGVVSAINGLSLQPIWIKQISGCESSAAPVIGNFTGGDMSPDVFVLAYKGQTPSYFEYYQIMMDGINGEIKWLDSLGDMHFPSANAIDANGDGRDEVLVSFNNHSGYFNNELVLIDFQNDTLISVVSPTAGVNLASTPLIDDIDNNGLIDIIYSYKADSLNPSAWNGFYINSITTNISMPNAGIAWGAYMGTNHDGLYNTDLNLCNSNNMVTSWNMVAPSCNLESDGKIYPLSFGTTYPLTYIWSTGDVGDTLSNVPAGSYKVYTTDSLNCIEVYNVQLNDPYFISFGNIIHNTCYGDSAGSATVLSSGCTCQFSGCLYSWANGNVVKYGTNLSAGFWEVVITHTDGCVVVDSVYINDGIPLIDSVNVIDSDCYYASAGSIELYPLDSNSTFYSWSNGQSNSYAGQLIPGEYSVEVSNAFCADSLFFTINSPDTVVLSPSVSPISCFNSSDGVISILGSGGMSPYFYSLDSIVTPISVFNSLSPSIYSVYITDSVGCNSDTTHIPLSQPTELILDLNSTPETNSGFFDGTASATIIGGTPPYTFLWNTNQIDSSIIYLSTGMYSVTVTDANGCFVSDSVFVGSLVGLSENNQKFNPYLYPNPSKGSFSLTLNNNKYNVLIYDMCGRLMYSKYNCYGSNDFNLNFKSGNYVLKLISDEKIANFNLSIIE